MARKSYSTRHTTRRQSLCILAWKRNIWTRIQAGNIRVEALSDPRYCRRWWLNISTSDGRNTGYREALEAAHHWAASLTTNS